MVPIAQPSQQAVQVPHSRFSACSAMTAPWHFLNFSPLPQWQGSFRPTRISRRSVYSCRHSESCPACENGRCDALLGGGAVGADLDQPARQQGDGVALRAGAGRGLARGGNSRCALRHFPVAARGACRTGFRSLRRALSDALRRTLIMSGVALTGIELFSFYLPVYGRAIDLSPSSIGMILSCYAVAGFIVRVVLHRLARRYSEIGVLTWSLFLAALAYASLPA